MERKKWKTTGEEGFTLIEVLVVLAILAILVAIVSANFTGILSGAQTKAGTAELDIVQTAVDVKMADLSWSAWTPVILPAAATSDMTDAAGGFGLAPTYMRDQTSKGTYSVTGAGVVTQADDGY